MEDQPYKNAFSVEKPKLKLEKPRPDDKPKRPVSKRAEISRRYYVKKTLLQGKVPKNIKEEDVKNEKLQKLNEVLERLKNKDKPVPIEDDEENEYDDDEEEMEEEEEDEIPVRKNETKKKVVSREVYDKSELMDKLDAITDMLMYLVKQEEAREDDENTEDEEEEMEEEEPTPEPVRQKKPIAVNFANQPSKIVYF